MQYDQPNLFDSATDHYGQRSTQAFVHFRKGVAEGRDIGHTEMRNRAIDAAASASIRDRKSKKSLAEYMARQLTDD